MNLLALLTAPVLVLLSGCSDSMVSAYCNARLPDASVAVETKHEGTRYGVLPLNATLPGVTTQVNGVTIGHTSASIEHAEVVDFKGVTGLGFACARPQVRVTLTLKDPLVQTAQRMQPESCAHREVLRHQERHIQAYKDHLDVVAADVRAAFNQRHPQRSFVRAASAADLGARQQEELSTWLVPLIEKAVEGINDRSAAINSPTEIQQLAATCPEGF